MKQHKKYEHIFVTEDGKVFSKLSGKLKQLATRVNWAGYEMCSMPIGDGKSKQCSVHRLVAETYLPNPTNLREVDHIDCNKLNNKVSNLEWVSSKENKRRARENGLYDNTVGEKHHNSVLTEAQVHEICQHILHGLRNKDIAEIYGIDRHLVSHIKRGDLWRNISSQYNFTLKRNKRKSINFVKAVCAKIAEGFDDHAINRMFDGRISLQDIRRIRRKEVHKTISDSYF